MTIIAEDITSCINQEYRLKNAGEYGSFTKMQITIVVVGFIEILEFTFCIYLLISSVRLLRRFVIDHSSHEANERTAWMHVVMIVFIFLGMFF